MTSIVTRFNTTGLNHPLDVIFEETEITINDIFNKTSIVIEAEELEKLIQVYNNVKNLYKIGF